METKITKLIKRLPGDKRTSRYCAVFTGDEIQHNEFGTNLPLANYPEGEVLVASVGLCVNEGGISANYTKVTMIQNGRLLFLDAPEGEDATHAGATFVLTVEYVRE